MPVYKCRTLISTPHDLLRVAGRVPRLSSVYSRVKLLASRSEIPLKKIEREIARDPAISARLSRLARIMYPALERDAGAVTDILPILGGERIKHLMLVTAVAAAWRRINSSQFDMRRFWRLAARRALLARMLALNSPHVDPTRAFVAGLLGDIGHLVLHLGIPEPAQDARARAAQCGLPAHEVEADLLGFDYAQVGAVLMRRWHHCPLIEHAVEYQMHPLSAPSARGDACVLHIATHLADAIENGLPLEQWGLKVAAPVWASSGRGRDLIADIVADTAQDYEELTQALTPQVVLPAVARPAAAAAAPAVPIGHARAKQLLHLPSATPATVLARKAG